MGKVVACVNLTLDGVMQSPGRPDEDTRDGFTRGGWGAPYGAMAHAGEVFANAGALLLGRRTYEDFARVWPNRPESPHSAWLASRQKYVASRTLKDPLPWENSTLVRDDLPATIGKLRTEMEDDVLIMGSGDLLQSLMRDNLVDRYVLLVHPLVLGAGRRLFRDGGPELTLRLASSDTTPNGVIVSTYEPVA